MSERPSPEAFARAVLGRLVALSRALGGSGWPELSPWWRDVLARFLASGVRQLVARVGRRGGKSSSACVFAVAFAMVYMTLGLVPPGDVGWIVFVSVGKDEAAQRLSTITAILRAIGVAHSTDGDTVLLEGTNIGFRVQACTVASVSGWTSILVIADEVAKWRDRDTGANPASEVLAALRPTMATQPLARMLLISSPVGQEDAHATAFEAGDTSFQMIAHAASWIANPTLTEQATHDLEPDLRIWSREYAALPQAGALGAFDAEDIARAFNKRFKTTHIRALPIVTIDVSSGRKDAWTWGACSWIGSLDALQLPFLRFEAIDGIAGRFFRELTGAQIIERIVAFGTARSAVSYHGDQREALMVSGEFAQHGARFYVHDWTSASKPRAVERVRRWLREGCIELPEHEQLRRELLAFEERISPSGQFTFGARGSGHDDYVALLITAAMADEERRIPGSLAHARFDDSPLPDMTTYESPLSEGMGPSLGEVLGRGGFGGAY